MRFAIPREKFLQTRRAEVDEAMKQSGKTNDEGFHVIVCDPGDEIVYDRCNGGIETETIVLDLKLNCVLCPDCLVSED